MADTESDETDTESGQDTASDDATEQSEPEHDYADKSDHDVFVDRDKIDFDPDDGLLSGTAIKGGTDIPGPHETVDDVTPDDDSGESDDAEGSGGDAGSDKDGTDDEES